MTIKLRTLSVSPDPLIPESLKGWGYEVASAAEMLSALCLWQSFRPDVVIVQLGAGVEATELARNIRAEPRGDAALLIGYSAARKEYVPAIPPPGFDFAFGGQIRGSFLREYLRHYQETIRRGTLQSN